MAQVPSLLQKARERQAATPKEGADGGGGSFKKPNMDQFIPPEAKDAVQRVVAAGMKVMFNPEMRQELMEQVDSPAPVPQKLAEAVTGLMLTLDKQSQGGIPIAAIFPAGMELMAEGAGVLQAAGQPVSQEDFNEAARMMFVLMGRKLGASDEDLMGAAEQAAGGAGGEPEAPPEPGAAEQPMPEVA